VADLAERGIDPIGRLQRLKSFVEGKLSPQ
jgi:hypothetical protein